MPAGGGKGQSRRLEPGVEFGTSRAPTAGTRRWVRNYPRADGWNPALGSALPTRRPLEPGVGFGVTQAPTLRVQRRVQRYPNAGPRRPSPGTVLPKPGLPTSIVGLVAPAIGTLTSIVGHATTQAPIVGTQVSVGGISCQVVAVQASAGDIQQQATKSAGEPRSASVARIGAFRAGHTGLRSFKRVSVDCTSDGRRQLESSAGARKSAASVAKAAAFACCCRAARRWVSPRMLQAPARGSPARIGTGDGGWTRR